MRTVKSGMRVLKSGMRTVMSGMRTVKSEMRTVKSGMRTVKSGMRAAVKVEVYEGKRIPYDVDTCLEEVVMINVWLKTLASSGFG